MKFSIVNQWRWPLLDFDVFAVGFSWFGKFDYYLTWSAHLTILGVCVYLAARHEVLFDERKQINKLDDPADPANWAASWNVNA